MGGYSSFSYIHATYNHGQNIWDKFYIREETHFNLQSVKLTLLSFFQYKARILAILTLCARYKICSKLTIKTPEYVKLTTKLKNKDLTKKD